ncbi:5-oxoprolinase subunit C family protein [Paenibacillus puerhi]|uniref:5-oxoprolinase subunit C family protein n=1 Tax=Paenibacillus puerhi TaxID=2692622 RepID=UPI001359B3ED|nr:biotin-dependent carboxyltransferase family protein [Paenibacillus puerhi]
MSLQVMRPGMLTTVQDLGRTGKQRYGVVVGGAMDPVSLRIANLLVGNEEGEAALEITVIGPTLAVRDDLVLACCGGDLSPTIDGQPLPQWRPVLVRKGSVIKFGACRYGSRAYLAVAGGLDVPLILGSRSTYVRGGLGGFEGRALAAGDVLNLRAPGELSCRLAGSMAKRLGAEESFACSPWYVDPPVSLHLLGRGEPVVVRAMRGADFNSLKEDSRERFFAQIFQLSTQSDRMGYRLHGSPLEQEEKTERLSEAVSRGTVQLPPEGQPILLMADRQTTGGYPRIAHVASVDIPLLSQLQPGQKLGIREISLGEAERLYIRQEQELNRIRLWLRWKLRKES